MDESVTLWFEAAVIVDGGHDVAAKRWKMISAVLRALECTDVHLRETEHRPAEAATRAAGSVPREGE